MGKGCGVLDLHLWSAAEIIDENIESHQQKLNLLIATQQILHGVQVCAPLQTLLNPADSKYYVEWLSLN